MNLRDRRESDRKYVESLHLEMPELTGKSEKQINYAADARARFLHINQPAVAYMAKWLRLSRKGKLVLHEGRTMEEELEARLSDLKKRYYWPVAVRQCWRLLTTCTDAGELLDEFQLWTKA